jgi:hypothetical protein
VELTISDIFPTANNGFENVGFFLGAGASLAAGQPSTCQLTCKVLKTLQPDEISLITDVLSREHLTLAVDEGEPDIETLADLVKKHKHLDVRLEGLLRTFRNGVFGTLSACKLTLETHIMFFENIKKRIAGKNTVVWIFTTNYDLVLETAAGIAGITIINGFDGINIRTFRPDVFELSYGKTQSSQFHPDKHPRIHLVKLHGSISWFYRNNIPLEIFHKDYRSGESCMVLPGKTKERETFDKPYGEMFRYAIRVIGTECKYLVVNGCSFRDQHVNETLFMQKLRDNSVKITALLEKPTKEIEQFESFDAFNYITPAKSKLNGISNRDKSSDIWMFEQFVDFLS